MAPPYLTLSYKIGPNNKLGQFHEQFHSKLLLIGQITEMNQNWCFAEAEDKELN